MLHGARTAYQQKVLLDSFTFASLNNDAKTFLETIETNSVSFNNDLLTSVKTLVDKFAALIDVGNRFCNYMRARFDPQNYPENNRELQLKLKAAVVHFKKEFEQILDFLKTIKAETDSRLHAKEYNEAYKALYIQSVLKLHHITAFTEGFSLEKYYSAKKNFLSPAVTVNAYAASGVSADQKQLSHPQLYQQLRSLRDDICNRTNSPVYMVASAKTLEELAEYLPQNKTDLMKITGFGKVSTAKYGEQFLNIIKRYCDLNAHQTRMDTKIPKRKRTIKEPNDLTKKKKEPTHKTTLEFYNGGKDIDAIAKTRGLAKSTIESHLAHCVGEGLLDPLLFTTTQKMNAIQSEEELLTTQGATAVKIKLGGNITYFDIKLATQYNKFYKSKT